MRRISCGIAIAATALCARPALPCGAPFGDGFSVEPDQKIIIVYDNPVETYIFSPSFCGEAAQFGLILPVPSQLASEPALADPKLFDELAALTAPEVVVTEECTPVGIGCGGMDTGVGEGPQDSGSRYGVDVIDKGQVGIFTWVLIRADSAAAFTDWLDSNAFPYRSDDSAHFDYYVQQQWYFVAFKVSADTQAPPAGQRLCGKLGPLSLRFSTARPLIPARIVATDHTNSAPYLWQVHVLAAAQAENQQPSFITSELRYSSPITGNDLAQYPQVATLASGGYRITTLNLTFAPSAVVEDIVFEQASETTDFRAKEYRTVYKNCGGCSALPTIWVGGSSIVVMLLGLKLSGRRRRQSVR